MIRPKSRSSLVARRSARSVLRGARRQSASRPRRRAARRRGGAEISAAYPQERPPTRILRSSCYEASFPLAQPSHVAATYYPHHRMPQLSFCVLFQLVIPLSLISPVSMPIVPSSSQTPVFSSRRSRVGSKKSRKRRAGKKSRKVLMNICINTWGARCSVCVQLILGGLQTDSGIQDARTGIPGKGQCGCGAKFRQAEARAPRQRLSERATNQRLRGCPGPRQVRSEDEAARAVIGRSRRWPLSVGSSPG